MAQHPVDGPRPELFQEQTCGIEAVDEPSKALAEKGSAANSRLEVLE